MLTSSVTGYRFRVFTRVGAANIWRNIRESWTLAGKLRTAWHVLYDGELCNRCGRRYDRFLWWCPDNALYARLTGEEHVEPYGGGLYCPRCFEELARRAGLLLQWQPRVLRDTRMERLRAANPVPGPPDPPPVPASIRHSRVRRWP